MTASAKEQLLTIERLKEVLDYDPETGIFRWRNPNSNRVSVGGIAGTITPRGYRRVAIDGELRMVHRLAWFWVYGEWPFAEIDHINGDKLDNRIINLREATRAQNGRNSKRGKSNISGYKGVFWNTEKRKWAAQITVNRRNVYLGVFNDPALAYSAYLSASKKYHGEFGRAE